MKKLSYTELAKELANSEFLRTRPVRVLANLFERDYTAISEVLTGVNAKLYYTKKETRYGKVAYELAANYEYLTQQECLTTVNELYNRVGSTIDKGAFRNILKGVEAVL